MSLKRLLLIAAIVARITAAPVPVPGPIPEPVPEPVPEPAPTGYIDPHYTAQPPPPPPPPAPEPVPTGPVDPQYTGVPAPQVTGIPPGLLIWWRILEENYRQRVTSPYTLRGVEQREDLPGPITENGIKENQNCEPLTVIFARGSGEEGNMGSIVGPSLASALRRVLDSRVLIQGVDYHASMELDNPNFGEDGGPEIVNLVQQSLSQCPHSKIALAGYSQGAMVVRHATSLLEAGQVAAVVAFGDPLKDAVPFVNLPTDKVKQFCAPGDPVCMGGTDNRAHLWYAEYAEEAAQFIIQAVGV
ncbi:hypothetical protein VTO42DRAFT_4521 [Malbranchea cinnamomea]